MATKTYKQAGDELWRRTDKINAELFTLTYGALVVQLIKDYEDYSQVNKQLDKMGFSIGSRIIEDFLARSGQGRCRDFREVAEVLAQIAFKAFLNITPSLIFPSPQRPVREFSLVFHENPLTEFVELPEDALPSSSKHAPNQGPALQTDEPSGQAQEGLWYSNVLCGVVRGALEMVQYQVTARFVSDVLRGDETTEMKVTLLRIMDEEVPAGDD